MATDLNDREAARLLDKHPRTIQRWCERGKLPGAYKAGRSWRIPRRALQQAKLGPALADDDWIRELQLATATCKQIRAEADHIKRHRRASMTRDWPKLARELKQLALATDGLEDIARRIPADPPRPPLQHVSSPRQKQGAQLLPRA